MKRLKRALLVITWVFVMACLFALPLYFIYLHLHLNWLESIIFAPAILLGTLLIVLIALASVYMIGQERSRRKMNPIDQEEEPLIFDNIKEEVNL